MSGPSTRTQGSRGLEADKTGADHDRAARAACGIDDRPAIRQRPQRMDMPLVGARDRQPHRFGACRQQQTIIGNIAPACDDDVMRGGID
jgi:hypothetical protein